MITEKQFEEMFRSFFADMCNVAYTVLKDKDLSHDIAQQVFINVWDKRDDLNFDVSAFSYLRRSTINLSLNHIEKHGKEVLESDFTQTRFDGDVVSDRSDYLPGEVDEAIKRAVEKLPQKAQTVFSLSRFQGMSNQEIADNLGISVKGVEKHISKSLKDLRFLLKPYLNYIEIFLIFMVGLEALILFL